MTTLGPVCPFYGPFWHLSIPFDPILTRCDPSGIHSVANLLWHLPTGIVDRRQVRRVADLVEGEIATVLLKVGGSV